MADDLDRRVEIGPNVVATVSTSGAKAFTVAGGRDIFADIEALALRPIDLHDQALEKRHWRVRELHTVR